MYRPAKKQSQNACNYFINMLQTVSSGGQGHICNKFTACQFSVQTAQTVT